MLRRILVSAGAAVAMIASAGAADLSAGGGYKDGYEPFDPWTGFYIGAGAGPSAGHTAYHDAGLTHINGTFDSEHAFASGDVGYNFQSGHILYGIEADLGYQDIAYAKYPFPSSPGSYYGADGGAYGHVTARLGILVPRTLLYAKGGVAFMDFNGKASYAGNYYSKDETLTGWTAGGGIEFLLFPKWTIKVEYLHFDFGASSAFSDYSTYKVHFDPAIDTVKFGINYHFHSSYESLK